MFRAHLPHLETIIRLVAGDGHSQDQEGAREYNFHVDRSRARVETNYQYSVSIEQCETAWADYKCKHSDVRCEYKEIRASTSEK